MGDTAGDGISDEQIRAHLDALNGPVVLARARVITVLLAASCAIFFLGRALSGHVPSPEAQAIRIGNLVVLLAALPKLYGAQANRWAKPVVMLAFTLSLLCSSLVCTLENDSLNNGLGGIAITSGAAAFVPWSTARQLFLVVFSAAVLAANQIALGAFAGQTELIMNTTALIIFGSTVLIVRTLEAARRKGAVDELRRRQAERRLREANELLEQRVQERTAEMREAVEELRAFSYSVSHDLRSPLRAINGMSQLIEDEYAGRLDEAATKYLESVKRASRRMGHLIDGLLARSRVGWAEMHPTELDLAALADTVIADLCARDPDRAVRWVRPGTLEARGDGTLVAVVLKHLLGNAWKFTRETPNARIELGTTHAHGRAEYFVRDNGVGFRMDHAGKLFENFQRLHGEEYEGTGIGLATVRRIVARHDGTVRIHSAPGEGSTVYFRLGAKQ